MVANIIVVVLVLTVFYAYANHNREFSATTSAIQQIWSGTCRLACRQNESGFRRLSDLIDQEIIVKPGPSSQDVTVDAVGLAGVCVCETCPCPLIDTLLKICTPVINIYSWCIEILSNFYCDIIKTLSDLYIYVQQVMTSSVSCQRPTQRSSISKGVPNLSSTSPEKLIDEVPKTKSLLNLKPSTSITFKNEAGTSKGQNLNLEIESLRTIESTRSCSRCTEKGAICIDKCPRANEKRE